MRAAIESFHAAEQAIDTYNKRIRNVIFLITDHLNAGAPISNELRDLLMNRTQAPHLRRCMFILDENAIILHKQKQRMLNMLGNNDVSGAVSLARGLSSALLRSLESVVGENPYESDLLPPAYAHFKTMKQAMQTVFPRTIDSPLETKEERQFSEYLRTIENPWAKYATN